MYVKGKWLKNNVDMLYYTGTLNNEKLNEIKTDLLYRTTITNNDLIKSTHESIIFFVMINRKWFKAYTY